MDRETIITALQIALLANVAVIAFALAGLRVIRGARSVTTGRAASVPVRDASEPFAGGTTAAASSMADPSTTTAEAWTAPRSSTWGRPAPSPAPHPVEPPPTPRAPSAGAPAPGQRWSWPLPDRSTDAAPSEAVRSSRAWTAAVASEGRRQDRHRRPASIVVVELDGLHRLAASLGSDLAAQVIAPTAMILRSTIRASDVVAQYSPTGIRLLLPETEEVGARMVVERVRSAAESWLAAGGIRVRLAMGWSSSDGSASIAEVEEQAVVAAERERGLPV